MTHKEWKKVKRILSVPKGCVKLIIDRYMVEIFCTFSYSLTVYVYNMNGEKIIDWYLSDFVAQKKFAQVRKHTLHLPWKYYFSPYWNSFRSMKSHFIKNNNSIELAEEVNDK